MAGKSLQKPGFPAILLILRRIFNAPMGFDPYIYLIIASSALILSFLFNGISDRTNIPAVLLLITAGILLKWGIEVAQGNFDLDLAPVLELTGIMGLIMIVLEAALDLELKREKSGLILSAFGVAASGLLLSSLGCTAIIWFAMDGISFLSASFYGVALSILSSAIIIPSVGNLPREKKEFHVYESTFSDILGILLFYFLEALTVEKGEGNVVLQFSFKLLLTILVAVLASYLLVYLFQNLGAHVKLFFLIAILLLLYSVGKLIHLSSLIVILVFGLILSNHTLFFRGILQKWLKLEAVKQINQDFHMVTAETAFVVRTFFFVVFGMTMSFAALGNMQVILVSVAIIAIIYLVRLLIFWVFIRSDYFPQVMIGSRGLISILLFYSIPESAKWPGFDEGILFLVIIITNIVMAAALIIYGRQLARKPWVHDREAPVTSPAQLFTGFKSTVVREEYPDQGQFSSGSTEKD